jgi:hypothetical protein
MEVLGYKITYTDGTVRKAPDFNDLPNERIQIVMVFYVDEYAPGKHYRKMMDGCDWYYVDRLGELQGVRSEDTGIQTKPTGELSKSGEYTTDENFKKLTDAALADVSW